VNQKLLLTLTSLLSILLMLFHVTDDIVRGWEPGTLPDLGVVLVFALLLYGTLVLTERRSGYIIVLLGSLLAMLMPVIHMMGKGVGRFGQTSGGFFLIWTLLAMGTTGLFSLVLSVRALWSLGRSRKP
jgi:hypothetical protein